METDALFKKLADNSLDIINILNADATIRYVSNATQRILGYEPAARVGRSALEFVHPEDQRYAQEHFQKLAATPAGKVVVEFRIRHADGSWVWLEVSGQNFLHDPDLQGILINSRDITERKHIEEKLRAAEETYRNIFLNAQVGMFRTDVQTGLLLDANDALAHFVGFQNREEMLSASLRIAERYVYPGDREKILTLLRSNGEVADFEVPFWRNDGETIIMRLSARLLPDKGWIDGMAMDITKERHAEVALRESEEKFRQIAENIGEVFWLRSADNTRMLYINPVYERVWGRTCRSLYENPQSFMDSVSEEDKPIVFAEFAKYAQTGEFALDYRIVRPDGEIRWVHARSFAVKDEQGRIVRHTGSAVDITARKQAEELMQVRLRLMQFAATHTLAELLQRTLDEVEALTGSLVGFYHFVDVDQQTLSLQAWSTRTVWEFCRTEGYGMHYAIANAGVWADCVRQRRAIIHNDYAALPKRRGLPPGHAPVARELVVPIFRGERVVAILGAGNKPSDYTEQDVKIVTYIADAVWETVERKHAEVQLQDYQRQLEAQNLELRKLLQAIEQSGSIIVTTDTKGLIQYANPRFEQTTGYTREEVLGQNPRILKSNEHSTAYYRELWQTISGGRVWRGEFHNRRKDGTLYWEAATIAPVQDGSGQIINYIATKEDITERKEAEAALLRYAGRLEMLHEMGDAILAARSPEDTAQAAIRYLQEVIPDTHVWVVELDNSAGVRHFLAGQLADGRALAPIVASLPFSAQRFEPLALESGQTDPWRSYVEPAQLSQDSLAYTLLTQYNARCYYLIPLQAHQQWVGLLNLALVGADVLTAEDEQVVQEMANSLAIALYQARLYAQIQEDARIKADLLREVNHRVSNNLMAIIGLMYAEGRYASPESREVVEATLERLIQRVEGLAEVHRMLSESRWAPVCLNDLAVQIIQMGRRSLPVGQIIEADISPVPVVVSPRQAGYLALIITELVTNTIKYALRGRAAVRIAISISEEAATIDFAYRDDGPGYPADVLRLEKYDVGLHLVQQLTRSLDGILTLNNEGGAVTIINFGSEAKDRT